MIHSKTQSAVCVASWILSNLPNELDARQRLLKDSVNMFPDGDAKQHLMIALRSCEQHIAIVATSQKELPLLV